MSTKNTRLRVGVLMGGRSQEREVSFNSGRTVCDHLDTALYTVSPIFQTPDGTLYLLPWCFLHRGKITDFLHRLAGEADIITWDTLKDHIDFAYIAMNGRFAEDGILQGMLEVLGIPYLGSGVLSSALCMDKHLQKDFLARAGISTPRGFVLTPQKITSLHDSPDQITQLTTQHAITFPCIVKPLAEGSSLGVSVVHRAEDMLPALMHARHAAQEFVQPVLVEEQIQGMEFSCIILVDQIMGEPLPLPPTEIVPEESSGFFDYEQKYMPGRAVKYTPARCTKTLRKKIQETCITTMRTLNITTIARIDGILTPDEQVVIFDPATLSGLDPASFVFREAAELGMGHADVINHLISTELNTTYSKHAALQTASQESIMSHQKTKKRVAVLFGGESNEREISLESGRNVIYKLSPHDYEPIPLFANAAMELFQIPHSLLVRNRTSEIADLVTTKMRVAWSDLPQLADFVFIALHGGKGENGAVQGALEMLNLPYNGSSVLPSALCMDKYRTAELLAQRGFAIPVQQFVTREAWHTTQTNTIKMLKKNLTLPLVVKPHDDGCSMHVAKATTWDTVAEKIAAILASDKDGVLLEQIVGGMELTVGVIGNDTPRALPPSQAIATDGILSVEEKFLPGTGENQTPAPLSLESTNFVQKTVEEVYQAAGCSGYARIDCFYQSSEHSPTGEQQLVILEINTLPGLTPATCLFHQAAEEDISPVKFVGMLVQLGMERHEQHRVVAELRGQEKPAQIHQGNS